MSELNDRMGVERDFAKRLSRLTSRQRRELRDLLGDPPDVRRVSAADWQRWEDERRKELTLILLAIFLATLRQHVDEMVPGAMDDGTALAVNREALAKAGALAADSAASTISTARDIVTASADVIATGTKADIDAVLVSALGPERDAVTAATATTAAQTAGTNAARLPLEMVGYNLVTRWITETDGKVCALCSALNGKSVDLWGLVLEDVLGPGGTRAIESIVDNGGPPAHPYCRCHLQTRVEPMANRVRVAG